MNKVKMCAEERGQLSESSLSYLGQIMGAALSADDVDTGIIGEVGVGRKAALVGKLSLHSACGREYLLRTVILRSKFPSRALGTAASQSPEQ